MQPKRVSRRTFFKQSAAAAGGAAPYFVPAHVLGGEGRVGANDRVHVGIVGVGVRGKYLIANMPATGRVVALCDCHLPRIAGAVAPQGEFAAPLAAFREADAATCARHQDYRRMFDREKLDAVVISTPDHHHVLAAMLACQAGLDVYCEKPLSLTIAEGRALAKAVKRYDRVLQVGSQQRTMEFNRFACEFVRDGRLGKVTRVELPNYPGPLPMSPLASEPAPEGLEWELFLGPAESRGHHRKLWVKEEFNADGLLWRGWDLWRDYSGHLMTNWGGHGVDMAQYALGKDGAGPVEIWPEVEQLNAPLDRRWLGTTPPLGYVRNATADRLRFCPVTMRYADGIELRFAPQAEGVVFYGSQGTMTITRNAFRAEPAGLVANPPDPALKEKWLGAGHVARPHLANWLDCVKTRQTPHAPVEAGHRTATICHLANIARELRRRLRWDPAAERFVDDDEANRLVDRPRRKGFELPQVG